MLNWTDLLSKILSNLVYESVFRRRTDKILQKLVLSTSSADSELFRQNRLSDFPARHYVIKWKNAAKDEPIPWIGYTDVKLDLDIA